MSRCWPISSLLLSFVSKHSLIHLYQMPPVAFQALCLEIHLDKSELVHLEGVLAQIWNPMISNMETSLAVGKEDISLEVADLLSLEIHSLISKFIQFFCSPCSSLAKSLEEIQCRFLQSNLEKRGIITWLIGNISNSLYLLGVEVFDLSPYLIWLSGSVIMETSYESKEAVVEDDQDQIWPHERGLNDRYE